MSRKKFSIILERTGKKYKPDIGEMIVMNNEGSFFLLCGLGTWDLCIKRLDEVVGNYSVIWKD